MTVSDTYSLMQYCVNKAQGGYLKPADFNLVINQGSNSYLDFLLGQTKERKVTVGLWVSRRIRNSLAPFINPLSVLTVDNTGFAPNPTGYILIDDMFDANLGRINFVQQNSLYSYLASVIDPIATNPIYLIENGGFRFYPNNIGTAKISFIQQPPTIVWGFTLDSNQRPVYNPATSVDPKWSNIDVFEVIVRALAIVGVNLQAGMVEQYANSIKHEGQ